MDLTSRAGCICCRVPELKSQQLPGYGFIQKGTLFLSLIAVVVFSILSILSIVIILSMFERSLFGARGSMDLQETSVITCSLAFFKRSVASQSGE